MSQQDSEQGEGQRALTLRALLQRTCPRRVVCENSVEQEPEISLRKEKKGDSRRHLIPAECLQMVQDLHDQGLTQLVDL